MNDKPNFAQLATEIHADNVRVGWWTDIKTGESTLHTRNRPEMLMLAVSEIAEAADGADGRMDDKLPHLPMYDVELADFVIRQLDQIGAEVSCGHEMPDWDFRALREVDLTAFRPMSRSDRLMDLVGTVATAMEHYRKGRVDQYILWMSYGIMATFIIAEVEHIDLLDIIAQKRAFNATRADHQIANRLKEGGQGILTFEKHERAIHAAKKVLNDTIYAAAEDGFTLKYDTWDTTIQKTNTRLVGRLTLSKEVK